MIWYTVADGFFYFLPVILGYTAAKKFKMSEYTGMALGISLCYPTMVALKGGEALGTVLTGTAFEMSFYTTFFGIPVIFPSSGYTSSVIPIVICCFFAAKLEKWLNQHLSDMIKNFITPVCVLVIMSSLTYLIIGPVSGIICGVLTLVFETCSTSPSSAQPWAASLSAHSGRSWSSSVSTGRSSPWAISTWPTWAMTSLCPVPSPPPSPRRARCWR